MKSSKVNKFPSLLNNWFTNSNPLEGGLCRTTRGMPQFGGVLQPCRRFTTSLTGSLKLEWAARFPWIRFSHQIWVIKRESSEIWNERGHLYGCKWICVNSHFTSVKLATWCCCNMIKKSYRGLPLNLSLPIISISLLH